MESATLCGYLHKMGKSIGDESWPNRQAYSCLRFFPPNVCLYYGDGLRASNWQFVRDVLPNWFCRLLQISAKRCQFVYVLSPTMFTSFPQIMGLGSPIRLSFVKVTYIFNKLQYIHDVIWGGLNNFLLLNWKPLFISLLHQLHQCDDFLDYPCHFLGEVLPSPALYPRLELI